MPLFRKKPIVIKAEQWFPGREIADVTMVPGLVREPCGCLHGGPDVKVPVVQTLEGEMHVSPGDWIITGVNGEVYPCKPDIFEKTYDPLQEED